MSSNLEEYLAKLYSQGSFRREFLESPGEMLLKSNLTAKECQALLDGDMVGIRLAGNIYSAKRGKYRRWTHGIVYSAQEWPNFITATVAGLIASEAVEFKNNAENENGVIDLVDWTPHNLHNRETSLADGGVFPEILKIWRILRESHLFNHHLLRCYIRVVNGRQRITPLGDQPLGIYESYLNLANSTDLGRGTLIAFGEIRGCQFEAKLAPTGLITLPAQVAHQIIPIGRPGEDIILGFRTLYSVD